MYLIDKTDTINVSDDKPDISELLPDISQDKPEQLSI